MKQRVAIARALVLESKVLLMDEPFGALDAFTRMNLQDDLIELWQKQKFAAIFVTHDIDEAVYLADRVVVMTSSPGEVKKVFKIELSRPRVRTSQDFNMYRSEILKQYVYTDNRLIEYQIKKERFDTPIIESFGISEGASQITANPINSVRKVGSAGKPVGNELAVVDENGAFLPDGETGEIVVRGDNVFFGYFNKPEETAAALRDGWFHTGDIGCRDSDGYYFLKGITKELINRAGEKFSPREIDEVLYRINGVELAAAVGVPDPLYNEEVVAYIKLRDGANLSERDIIEFCKGKIADFKLPKKVFFVDDLPKGPSGKIQRLKLIDIYKNSLK